MHINIFNYLSLSLYMNCLVLRMLLPDRLWMLWIINERSCQTVTPPSADQRRSDCLNPANSHSGSGHTHTARWRAPVRSIHILGNIIFYFPDRVNLRISLIGFTRFICGYPNRSRWTGESVHFYLSIWTTRRWGWRAGSWFYNSNSTSYYNDGSWYCC